MGWRLSRPILFGIGLSLLFVFPVVAQYSQTPYDYGNQNSYGGHPGFFGQAATLPTFSGVFWRFAIDAIAAGLGFAVGAFFSPFLRPFRRILFFVGLAVIVLYAWLGYAPIADGLTKVIAIFAFFVALGYGIRLGAKAFLAERANAERPISFGSAKWATMDYLDQKELFNGSGFLLGAFAEGGARKLIHYGGPRHLLTVAPTRSGKGVSSIIPNLLSYEGSAFVIDPKGENALITAPRRGKGNPEKRISGLGQDIHLLDPWNMAAGKLGLAPACFNPLDWIKADDPDATENAFLLAEALVPSGAEGEAKFWDEESKALLCGIILYVAISKHEAANRHLGRVRDILLLGAADFKVVLENMYKETNPVVSSTASRTASKDEKLRSNVLAAVQSHTHFLDSPRIRESLSRSSFQFEDFKARPTTVYLILPADRLETFGRWLRLLIQQALTINARNIDKKPPRPVLFLLDEMAALGRLSMVEQAFGLMAGFGIQLWGIVQDLSQLERIYDKGWQTFISNSGVIQYFGSRDKITAEYFSTLCGVTTIRIQNFSYALGKTITRTWSNVTGAGNNSSSDGGSDSSSHTHTIGTNESQRQLAYPDELMVLKDDSQVIFIENLDPIQGLKLLWYKDSGLSALGVNLHDTKVPERQQQQIATTQPVAAVSAKKATAANTAVKQHKPATASTDYVVSTRNFYDPDFGAFPTEFHSDGSVVVQFESGPYRFESEASFKDYLDKARKEQSPGA